MAGHGAKASPFAGGFVICTPYGYKIVAPADAQATDADRASPERPAGQPLKVHFCPLCNAAHAGVILAPPTGFALDAPLGAPIRIFTPADPALPEGPALANLQARAPPPTA
jgi:hypothetical protein